ncbi:hypothetical protein ACIBKX_37535 [Streptomyces sp. NPDC050658]|uniref:hypothetical protein n=1 Tax=unclassified Streptomyces TaxID=2593676 RepID=UPI003420786B
MFTKRLLRRIGISSSAALVLLLPLGIIAPSSSASSADADQAPMECVGAIEATYDPPLGPTFRETTVSIEEDYDCADPVVTEGRSTSTYQQEASCLLPSLEDTLPPSSTVTYDWTSTGEQSQSTVQYDTTVVTHPIGQTVVTATGEVISGYREGSVVLVVVVRPNINLLECLASNVHQDNRGTVTLTIG